MNRLPKSPLVARALEVAEKHMGLRALADRLGVSEIFVHAWRYSDAEMPNAKFLQLVDLLTELDAHWTDGATLGGKAKHILVVDDHPDAADTLAALLKADGHEAVSVRDPRQAVTVAKALRPAIAMLDLRMPYIDGLQLARLIRRDAQLKHTCLVAITAETQDVYRQLAREAGFDAILKKPVDLALLRSIVAQFGN